jgi:hypothetical protein
MTTNTSPSPNFSGINFNAEFFSSSSTYLTEEEANLLYLNKTVPDTANVLETFTVGISATAIGANTASIDFVTSIGTNTTYIRSSGGGGALTICDDTTIGNLDFGTGTTRSGNINIGNGVGATGTIDIGNATASTRIGSLQTTGLLTATGNVKTAILDCNDVSAGSTALAIAPNVVNGNIVIGAALGVGDVAIGGAQSAGGSITLGSANTLMTLNGSVNATTELNTPILDCITDASAGSTALSIGPSVLNGNIVIGASLGIGDVSIGGAQSVGGTITLGSANTVTTASNGLTLPSGKYITTSHTGTVTAPTSAQVGYVLSGTNLTNAIPDSTNATSLASIALTPGSWTVVVCRQYSNSNGCTRVIFSFGTVLQTNDPPVPASDYEYGIVTPYLTSESAYVHLTTVISVQTAFTLYFNVTPTVKASLTSGTSNFFFKAVRIA